MASQSFSDAELSAVMANEAVTALSGWTLDGLETEDACDDPAYEETYRERLSQNADALHALLTEAIAGIGRAGDPKTSSADSREPGNSR